MSRLTQPVGPDDHVMGRSDARVTVVEYIDYECHHCLRAYHVVGEVMDVVGNEARLVVRHFPLTQIHPHALLAAEAAEAAAAQGFFWPMHDMLFENQLALDIDSLVIYADVLGLDPRRFSRDVHEGAYLARIQADFRSGVHAGVNGTPTFYVDGDRLDHGWDCAALLAAIRLTSQPAASASGRI